VEEAKKNLASFCIPKYIRIMIDFPKTNTGKIQKHLIKKDGITSDTWQNNI
jgi:crotonobetaine/carnitine-CoA ligase